MAFRAHLGNPGQFLHGKVLHLITSAKTPFPYKVTFTGFSKLHFPFPARCNAQNIWYLHEKVSAKGVRKRKQIYRNQKMLKKSSLAY